MTLLRSKPMAAMSARKRSLEPYHRRSRMLVLRRSSGACEGCKRRDTRLEVHHIAGRRFEPWCSHPVLTAALCPDCHRSCTDYTDMALVERLRETALQRLCQILGAHDVTTDGVTSVSLAVDALERNDVWPEGWVV